VRMGKEEIKKDQKSGGGGEISQGKIDLDESAEKKGGRVGREGGRNVAVIINEGGEEY